MHHPILTTDPEARALLAFWRAARGVTVSRWNAEALHNAFGAVALMSFDQKMIGQVVTCGPGFERLTGRNFARAPIEGLFAAPDRPLWRSVVNLAHARAAPAMLRLDSAREDAAGAEARPAPPLGLELLFLPLRPAASDARYGLALLTSARLEPVAAGLEGRTAAILEVRAAFGDGAPPPDVARFALDLIDEAGRR